VTTPVGHLMYAEVRHEYGGLWKTKAVLG
jgi:hypothetical protein